MKKNIGIIAVFLSVCLYVCSVPVCADMTPTVSVNNVKTHAGSTITMDVVISNNPGINSFRFGFDYDSSLLTLNDVQLSKNFPGQFLYIKKAVWVAKADNFSNGTVLTLSFTLSENAECGEIPVSVTFSTGDICNYNEKLVSFDSVPGKINVINKPRTGDINCDGKINAIDSNVMTRIITGQLKPDSYTMKCADINKDGKLNPVDSNILKSIIVGNPLLF